MARIMNSGLFGIHCFVVCVLISLSFLDFSLSEWCASKGSNYQRYIRCMGIVNVSKNLLYLNNANAVPKCLLIYYVILLFYRLNICRANFTIRIWSRDWANWFITDTCCVSCLQIRPQNFSKYWEFTDKSKACWQSIQFPSMHLFTIRNESGKENLYERKKKVQFYALFRVGIWLLNISLNGHINDVLCTPYWF